MGIGFMNKAIKCETSFILINFIDTVIHWLSLKNLV